MLRISSARFPFRKRRFRNGNLAPSVLLLISFLVGSPLWAAGDSCDRALLSSEQVQSTARYGEPSEISKLEFKEIQDLAGDLIRNYPPSQFVYVGLGRSPTPLLAYLRACKIGTSLNLPLSSMRSHPEASRFFFRRIFSDYVYFSPAIKESERDRLFAHFQDFLPSPESLEDKRILLVDFAQSGRSLISAGLYLERYYESLNLVGRVVPLALTDPLATQDHALNELQRLPLYRNELLNSLRYQRYDLLAEYGDFSIVDPKSALSPNQSVFQLLVDEFSKRCQVPISEAVLPK